jgi:uncharacterized protein YgiM (DUF1202 family)
MKKTIATLAIIAATFATAPRAEALTGHTEFCVNNSPDGTLNLRTTPRMTNDSNIIETLRNGDCGVLVAARNPARSGVMLRVTVNGRTGWVKGKWLKRASDYTAQSSSSSTDYMVLWAEAVVRMEGVTLPQSDIAKLADGGRGYCRARLSAYDVGQRLELFGYTYPYRASTLWETACASS